MKNVLRVLLIAHFIMSAGIIKFLIFSGFALHDIYHGIEPDLTQEWLMVEVTGGLVLFYTVVSFVMMMFIHKRAKPRAEPGT